MLSQQQNKNANRPEPARVRWEGQRLVEINNNQAAQSKQQRRQQRKQHREQTLQRLQEDEQREQLLLETRDNQPLEKQHQEQLQQLKRQHQEEKQNLKMQHAKRVQQLENKLERLEKQLEAQNKKKLLLQREDKVRERLRQNETVSVQPRSTYHYYFEVVDYTGVRTPSPVKPTCFTAKVPESASREDIELELARGLDVVLMARLPKKEYACLSAFRSVEDLFERSIRLELRDAEFAQHTRPRVRFAPGT